jgi:hypothetical protein
MPAKIVEKNEFEGIYGLPATEMIVELKDARRVYLAEGFGGMSTLAGGQYRWRHGIAVQVKHTDTIASLSADLTHRAWPTTTLDLMTRGCDNDRSVLMWDGRTIDQVAQRLLNW